MEEGIKDVEPVVEEALTAAQELMAHCSPNDVEVVQRKADSLSHANEKVVAKKEQKQRVLNESAEMVKKFYDIDKDLRAFFTDVSTKFENKSDEDVDCILVSILSLNLVYSFVLS